jgi:hypothetical protein
MLVPTKILPIHSSILYIASKILINLSPTYKSIDELFDAVNANANPRITFDKFILAVDFLYIIGKMDVNYEA